MNYISFKFLYRSLEGEFLSSPVGSRAFPKAFPQESKSGYKTVECSEYTFEDFI